MDYFITGATGFIGRFLVAELLKRDGARVHALVRKGSRRKLEELRARLGTDESRLLAVEGDLTAPALGLAPDALASLRALQPQFFHLAAIYDMSADADIQHRTNIEGTRHALEAAGAMQARCLHHVSSIAAGGEYPGVFTETMLKEATGLEDPYFYTKHASEKLVRDTSPVPWRVYRPSMVTGDSRTGEMDKVDGPYYLFRLLRLARPVLPAWLPLVGIEGGRFNIVPVDYVVKAMAHIAHLPDLDGRCFHLTSDEHLSLAELVNLVAAEAGTSSLRFNIPNAVLEKGPRQWVAAVGRRPLVKNAIEAAFDALDIPASMLGFLTFPTTYDRRQTAAALAGTGLAPPPLASYIGTLWRYWDTTLEPRTPRRGAA
jgi:thioester reductase-like protein